MINTKSIIGLLIKVSAFASTTIFYSCEKNQEEDWMISSEKCVFVDHHISTHGELIEGDYKGGLLIDFPTYDFDNSTKILKGEIDFAINKTLKIIYGDGISLSGVVGGGAATGLTGIYDLPYEHGKLKIIEMEFNGTVHFKYNDSLIVLKSNEEWGNTSSEIDTQDNVDGIAKAKI
ncbi:MAG: hypothetical protein KAQ62_08660, partial [Cyclobacteriaceae bacterium]|nr:hypothetical protein [Cyclobacteriaceae bacterium]